MSNAIEGLQPKLLWNHFYGITQVPRPSKQEGKILNYLKELVAKLGYEYSQDATGNMLIRKPAAAGYEQAPTVLIQGHVDMVCEKNKGTNHDFENDPIRVIREGEWITAEGTTLGADNGIGVAAALAILESKDVVHPPMEFLFTVDEETGLTGAKGLQPGFINASIMLNLDSEEDGALYVGCSGGIDTAGVMTLSYVDAPAGYTPCELQIGGLKGGHSGLDIHLGRGNAIKILTRTLRMLTKVYSARIASVGGGSKRNAIPREAEAVIYVPSDQVNAIKSILVQYQQTIVNEIGNVEPDVNITFQPATASGKVLEQAQAGKLIDTLDALPHGVIKMSADIPGLVETSTNLATLSIENNELTIGTSQRSSVESEKTDLAAQVAAVFNLAELRLVIGDGYPGWKPNMQSSALKHTQAAYAELFGSQPEIKAIHAGLECGLIGEVYPEMDMISFGPTIQGAHSPDERLNIPATEKFWQLVCKVLERVAKQN